MINTNVFNGMSVSEIKSLANFLTNSTTMTDNGLLKTKILSISEEEIEADGEEIIECVEGTVIDNLMTVDKNGNLRIYQERYVNCWTSGYWLIEGDNADIEEYWNTYIDVYNDEED